jgi:hypothetical protein
VSTQVAGWLPALPAGPARIRAGRWLRLPAVPAPPLIAAGWLLGHPGPVGQGAALLRSMDPGWLAVAVAAAAARWPAGGLNLWGAVADRLPVRGWLGRMLAGTPSPAGPPSPRHTPVTRR